MDQAWYKKQRCARCGLPEDREIPGREFVWLNDQELVHDLCPAKEAAK